MSTALRTESSRRPVTGWAFVALYAAAYAGAWLALLTPIMETLALRVEALAPNDAADILSLVLSVGALVAMVANPVFGRFSDRTTSSWGMRRPWLIGGALAGAVSLWWVATAPSIAGVLVGWCLTQLSFNAVLAPLAALLPDQVPMAKRGTVAGIVSICTPLGQLGGTSLTHLVSGSMAAMFMLPTCVGVAAILLLALVLPDRRLELAARETMRRRDPRPLLWISPRRHPDFARICAGRFFLIMGMSLMLAYQPFYLMSHLGYRAAEVPEVVFQSTLTQSIVVIIAGLASGRLSDLMRRRKVFVISAAAIYAVGALVVAAAHGLSVFLSGMALSGLGLGAYLSVDLAFITDVLPDKQNDAGRDLGVFNIASTLPQFIAPIVASVILALSESNYAGIFVAVAIVALLAAAVIIPVKSVP